MFQDYYKALEDADEKVQLANQIYDLVSGTVCRSDRMVSDLLHSDGPAGFAGSPGGSTVAGQSSLTVLSVPNTTGEELSSLITNRRPAAAGPGLPAAPRPEAHVTCCLLCLQVDRHLRKLDQELAKFKMELEADNAGITEILERREFDSRATRWG